MDKIILKFVLFPNYELGFVICIPIKHIIFDNNDYYRILNFFSII